MTGGQRQAQQPERHVDPQAERPLVREWNADVEIRHRRTTTGIAPIAAQRLEHRRLRAAVVKLSRRADDVACDNHLHGLQADKTRRIEEDGAHILGRGRASRVGMTQSARILFLQRESRPQRLTRRQRQHRPANGCREPCAAESNGLHMALLLLWFESILRARGRSPKYATGVGANYTLPW